MLATEAYGKIIALLPGQPSNAGRIKTILGVFEMQAKADADAAYARGHADGKAAAAAENIVAVKSAAQSARMVGHNEGVAAERARIAALPKPAPFGFWQYIRLAFASLWA